MDKKPWFKKKRIVIPLSILLASAVASIIDSNQNLDAIGTVETSATKAHSVASREPSASVQVPVKTEKPSNTPMGQQQRQFITIIEDSRSMWSSADTDLQRSEVLRTRDEALCAVLVNRTTRDWAGQVSAIGANGEGKAWVEISVGPDVRFVTWNNAVSDFGDGTLIARGSSLFKRLTRLAEGDAVRFSARLFRGDSTCLRKTNVTETFYVMDPKFLMQLTDVRGL